MQRQKRRTSILFFSLLLVQVLSPLAFAQGTDTSADVDTNADLGLLQQLNIEPTATAVHGWLSEDDAAGSSGLLYRDIGLIAPGDWTEQTGQNRVNGYHILGHTYPVPSEWHGELADAGIDCYSFMPLSLIHI